MIVTAHQRYLFFLAIYIHSDIILYSLNIYSHTSPLEKKTFQPMPSFIHPVLNLILHLLRRRLLRLRHSTFLLLFYLAKILHHASCYCGVLDSLILLSSWRHGETSPYKSSIIDDSTVGPGIIPMMIWVLVLL